MRMLLQQFNALVGLNAKSIAPVSP